MKHLLFTALTLIIAQYSLAQMDEKFYHPDTLWLGIDYPATEEIVMDAGEDAVYSFLLKPGQEVEVRGTVIYFHGNGSNASHWLSHLQPLLGNGFQVVIMDYRGYGKSTGKPTHNNIAEDAQSLFNYLMEREEIQRTPLVIYGASIGSQVATKIARDNNDKIAALVLDGAMMSFTDVALATSPAEYHPVIRQYVTSPYSAKEDIKVLKNIKVLFIHSKTDFIPFSGAREMYESAQCEKEFWEYEGEHVNAAILYPDIFISYVKELIEE